MTETTTPVALPLTSGQWTLDPSHSRIGFAIRHLGVSKVRGRFADFEATLLVGESVPDCAVTATVAVASLDTGNADRDQHVLSADLLDVARRPTLDFRSTGARRQGDDWTLDGELTIGEITRPLSLEVELGGVQEFIDGRRHAGFEAMGEIRRKDFDLGFGAVGLMLGDVVKIELDLQFVEPL